MFVVTEALSETQAGLQPNSALIVDALWLHVRASCGIEHIRVRTLSGGIVSVVFFVAVESADEAKRQVRLVCESAIANSPIMMTLLVWD